MEFGTVKTGDGFKAPYAMDAYQHVRQAAKMTARLQAATASGKASTARFFSA